jgi:malate dehydrogenase
VAERVLAPNQRLQLVGREGGRSARLLPGLLADLSDAYAEVAPEMDVAVRPEEVVADIIVMAGGATVGQLPADGGELDLAALPGRDTLAEINRDVFQSYADAIAANGTGHEIVLVVTNPVELGVEIMSRRLGRSRVIGIGGYSDSLRFRREIATEIGVRRQKVEAFVLGEHGEGMVPVWSSVSVHGMDEQECRRVMKRLRSDQPIGAFAERLVSAKRDLVTLLGAARVTEAFTYVDLQPPDLRVYLKPFVSHMAGAKTAHVTARTTCEVIESLIQGRRLLMAGQVLLDGEFYNLHGPVGVPVVVSARGWTRIAPLSLWEDEAELLAASSASVNAKIKRWMGHG